MVELVQREADLGAVRLGRALPQVGVERLLEHLRLLGEQRAQRLQLAEAPGSGLVRPESKVARSRFTTVPASVESAPTSLWASAAEEPGF